MIDPKPAPVWPACQNETSGLALRHAAGHDAGMLIYKIFRSDEWEVLRRTGETSGAPIDVQDGFVHFSTAQQVRETAALHFKGESDLFLISVDTDSLGADVKWETSRGGDAFPHLFRTLTMSDVVEAVPLGLADGAHVFPDTLT